MKRNYRWNILRWEISTGCIWGIRRCLKKMVEMAKNEKATPSVLIFEPHPLKLVSPDNSPKLLTSLSLRKKLLKSIGIKNIHIMPFDAETLNMDGLKFLNMIKKKFDAGLFAVGYNFNFGKKGAWDYKDLQNYCDDNGLKSIILDKFMHEGEEVSLDHNPSTHHKRRVGQGMQPAGKAPSYRRTRCGGK